MLPLLLGLPLMLTLIHIAFLEKNPAWSIVSEAEEEEKDVMPRPPRNPKLSCCSVEGWYGRSFEDYLSWIFLRGFLSAPRI